MTNSWDGQINRLSDQISDLRETLESSQVVEKEQLVELDRARMKLRALSADTDTRGLSELPRLLQSIMNHQSMAVIVAGESGRILLFNAVAERLLGEGIKGSFDTLSEKTSFFRPDRTTILGSSELPWARALKGDDIEQTQLFVKPPEASEGIFVSVSCTVLRDHKEEVSGAVVFLLDNTEQVQVEGQIRNLCEYLERQINNIETARSEINLLAEKLEKVKTATIGFDKEHIPIPAIRPPVVTRPAVNAAQARVLVVDDIPVNQKLLIMHLKKMNLEIDTAANGKEAVEKVMQATYALVFMDCDMPVMNGYEATQEIRRLEITSGKHVPIVAMTSYDREGDRERCLSIGMDEYLTKGTPPKKLQEVVQWCLSRHKPVHKEEAAQTVPIVQGEQVLDLDALTESFGADELQDVLRLFLTSTTTLASCLEFALEERDAQSVSHFAYSLKGPCASIGLTKMSDLSAIITSDAEAGRWEQAAVSCEQFKRLYSRVKEQVSAASEKNKWSLITA